jgi:chorismate-pyruvate lyase
MSPEAGSSPEFTRPLADFYRLAELTLPSIQAVKPDSMPETARRLLVHENDMTPTLERFHGARIHLKVLRSVQQDGFYFREVVLCLDGSERPVEFGANKVNLSLFPAGARELILGEHVPLGTILEDFKIAHTCHPSAYLRVGSDDLISESLGLVGQPELYGRRNTLRDSQGQVLSEVVEILAPG